MDRVATLKPFESIGESLAGKLSLESYPAQGFPSWKVSHLLKHLEGDRVLHGLAWSDEDQAESHTPQQPLQLVGEVQ